MPAARAITRERRREVLAEAASGIEEKVIDRIRGQARRLERVEVLLAAELGEHRLR